MHRIAFLTVLIGTLLGCDSTSDSPSDSLAGTYTLVTVDGASLPSGGVTSGQLRLYIDNTIPVYDVEWSTNGTRATRSGLYTVDGSAIEFTETSGTGGTASYNGRVVGDQIRVAFATEPFIFERTP